MAAAPSSQSPAVAASPAPSSSSKPNAPPPAATSPPLSSPPPPPAPLPPAPPPQLAASPPPASSAPPPVNPPPKTPSLAPPPVDSPPPPARSHSAAAPPPSASPPTTTPAAAAAPPTATHRSSPAHSSPPPPSPSHKPLPATEPASPHSRGTGSPNKSSTQQSSPPRPQDSSGGLGNGVVIAVGTVLALLVITLLGAAVWYTNKRRRRRNDYHAGFISPPSHYSSSQRPLGGDSANALSSSSADPCTQSAAGTGSPRVLKPCASDISMGGNSRFFTYNEMHHITDGFAPRNLLGEGGFGSVYRGRLPEGKEVAVKRLRDGSSGQGEREFQAEVEIISRVHHRHLVSLVGYCIANTQRLLVYDFVSNDTLHYHLHGQGRPVLDWAARVKIAAGAARGIAYLHEDCHPRIIHRDIKSSNILLDNNFDALVADFGLARLALDAVTHVTTRVMGTFGYMAPEYASSGKLTEKSDVFSFGVVLLELMTGRKPVDASRPLGDESLVEWARPLLSRALETGNLHELVDPRLEKNFNEVEMFRMIESAAACIRHSSSKRPRMSQVVRVLDSLADIDLTNGVQPGQSELFNVANTADIRMFQQMVQGNHQDDDSSGFSQYSWMSRSRAGAEATSSNSRIL